MSDVRIELPGCSMSANVYIRSHWTKQRQMVKDYAYMIRKAITVPEKPIERCLLFIQRQTHSKIMMDWDNLLFSHKGLVDALTARNKNGIGVIADDSPKCILSMPTVIEVSIGKDEPERTIIEILDLAEKFRNTFVPDILSFPHLKD